MMFRTKISFSCLLALACIATDTHTATQMCRPGWEDLGTPEHDVCWLAEDLLSRHCPPLNAVPRPTRVLSNTTSWYTASNFSKVANCACTKIVYNLLSACAGCQKWDISDAINQSWQSLKEYEGQTCINYQAAGGGIQVEPDDKDLTWSQIVPWSRGINDTNFNLAQALAMANPNNSVPTSAPSTTEGAIPMATSTPTPMAASGKSGPNVGAIAGGVVGGMVLLSAILGLLLFLRRYKRRARDVAPSDEFLKPEYYASPPLLSTEVQRDSHYRDDIEEEPIPPMVPQRLSWVGGFVATRRREDGGDELPPFTPGTYIGPSPHEKSRPERRRTDETDGTVTSDTHLLTSSSRPGTSE